MKKPTIILFLSLSCTIAFGQGLDPKYQQVVSDFIDCIKNQKKEKLANKVSFPLSREYPLPGINNKQAFLARYNEVFDAHLIKTIVTSSLTKDWSAVGWRGIMLHRGDLWLDYDGDLTSVNYQSKAEQIRRAQLIKIEKNSLHPSIKLFKEPVLIMETSKFRIRIDNLGKWNFRYTSWPLKSKMSDKPSLVIANGKWIPEGSGGNHRYEFKSGDYTYDCAITVLAEEENVPSSLSIYKSGKTILSQKAKVLKK